MSVVSCWEIVIKVSSGKLDLGSAPKEFIPKWQAAYGLKPLPLSQPHALTLQDVPADLHKDPFDRMLIVQASFERMVLITSDHALVSYAKRLPVDVLWAGR
jgi:PIN domain nuclease of toxin-antitoxin system